MEVPSTSRRPPPPPGYTVAAVEVPASQQGTETSSDRINPWEACPPAERRQRDWLRSAFTVVSGKPCSTFGRTATTSDSDPVGNGASSESQSVGGCGYPSPPRPAVTRRVLGSTAVTSAPRRDTSRASRERLARCETRRRLDGDLQRADSGEADPHACVVSDDRHEGVVAVRAAQDDAGAPEDVERPDRVSRAAACRTSRSRWSSRRRTPPGARPATALPSSISASISQPPVGPKRSVLTRLRLVPELHERLATASTNGVGPQT